MTPPALPLPRLDGEGVTRLRAAFQEAEYTADGVVALLGESAHEALGREETAPARARTRGDDPLAVLVRMFILEETVPVAAAERAFRPLPLDEAVRAQVLAPGDGGEGIRAAVDLRPYAEEDVDWWVASDIGSVRDLPGGLPPGAVTGVGPSSTTLAEWTVRQPVATALDLGTGCGVQALHLSRHAGRITATDRNARALPFADLTARLSGFELELLEGDLFGPVEGRRFDLIVSNPPFVISPGGDYLYRDSGLAGDAICRRLVSTAGEHLTEGGWCQLLASWQQVRGEDWRERVASWVEGTGCDALVVQRQSQDPVHYVGMWLKDSGEWRQPDYPERYERWVAHFAAQQVEALGYGTITLRRTNAASPVVVCEDLRHPTEAPLGPAVQSWFARQDFLRARNDAGLLDARFRLADVRLEQTAEVSPGGDGWQVVDQVVRQRRGFARRGSIDPYGAAILAGCDGTRRLRDLLDVLARVAEADAAELVSTAVVVVRELVADGFLEPAEDDAPVAGQHGVATVPAPR